MAIKASPQIGATIDLRALRSAAGLSQQRLAELAGCSLAAVALFERGYRPNTSTVLPRIVQTLNEEGRHAGNVTASENSGVGVAGRGSG